MKKTFNIIAILIFVAAAGFVSYKVFSSRSTKFYRTEQPKRTDIERHYKFTGNVYPATEIDIKSQLSGILDEVYVKIGDAVKKGDAIASVRMVPSSAELEQLETNVRLAKIELNSETKNYDRAKGMFKANAISRSEFEVAEKAYLVVKEKYNAATNQLNIIKNGSSGRKGNTNKIIATANGVVIDIPTEIGASVIERNNYNIGTTVATLAQTSKFVFRAMVGEQYLKFMNKGSKLTLTFAAYDSLSIDAKISKIASKGSDVGGVMKFDVEAEFGVPPGTPAIRSGYSATADIILQRAKNAIAIEEGSLHFSHDSVFVYVLDLPDSLKKEKPRLQLVTPGISDGTIVEIREGLSLQDNVITNYDD